MLTNLKSITIFKPKFYPMHTRRKFIKNASIVMASVGFTPYLHSQQFYRTTISPSDKIRLGVIGCKGMGWSNMRSLLRLSEVDCVALCDVDQAVLDSRCKDAEEITGQIPKKYKDFRKLLEDKDIDAVVIGTPDHWHTIMTITALQAGKHIYVEKPLANSIGECYDMVKAARNSSKLIQVGQWQRSGSHYRNALDFLQSGKLGKVRLVKTWAYQGWMKPVPIKPDAPVPPGVDYDMWLGPAPKRPFNENRFHFTFRWFWDYAGGLMTDWGVHEIDIALLGMKATTPKSVIASGGKFAYSDDASETPDTMQAVFEYDDFNMLWEHALGIDGGNYGKSEGIAFVGNKGTLVLYRQGWEIIPEKENVDEMTLYKMEAIPYQSRKDNYLDAHTSNFIDAIKANDASKLHCGIESGSLAAINAHMGNIAMKSGNKIYWHPESLNFGKDGKANEMLSVHYQNGWKY